MKEFTGRVAVITGGASGIGLGLAERFAREGMKIVVADIEQSALDQAVAGLAQSGAACMGVLCDVSEYAQMERLAQAAYDRFGAVHILCNNAGVGPQAAPSWAQTDADWRWVLGVNLWGVIHGTRAFVPRMIEQATEGHIVNTASLSGLLSMPYGAPYNVSKFGVVALTEALHYELAIARSQLKTSVLCPAWVATRILDSARNRPPAFSNTSGPQIDQEWAQAFGERLSEGLSPATVGEHVFDAIRDEQLYIWTHPEYKPAVRMRMEQVLDARNPDIAKMLGGLGKAANKTA